MPNQTVGAYAEYRAAQLHVGDEESNYETREKREKEDWQSSLKGIHWWTAQEIAGVDAPDKSASIQ